MVLAALTVGCSSGGDRPKRARRTPAKVVKAVARTGPGTIEGRVRYEGELPADLPVRLTGPRATECRGALEPYSTAVRRGTNGGIADVFVMVEGAEHPDPGTPRTERVHIRGCVLDPYVVDANLGDTLEISNDDGHAYFCGLGDGDRPAVGKQRVMPGQAVRFELDRAGGRRIDCSLGHPWLLGHLLVARHPFHAVTAQDGSFRIAGVPAGGYRVQTWHPTQRKKFGDVRVVTDEVARVEIVYRALGVEEDGGVPEGVPAADTEMDGGVDAGAVAAADEAPDAAAAGRGSADAAVAAPAAVPAVAATPAPAPPAPVPPAPPAPAPPAPPARSAAAPPASAAAPPASAAAPLPTPTLATSAATAATPRSRRELAFEAIQRGRTLLDGGQNAPALEAFREAVDLTPNSPAPYRGLGDANMGLGNTKAAIRAYRRYLLANPGALDAPVVRARLQTLEAR